MKKTLLVMVTILFLVGCNEENKVVRGSDGATGAAGSAGTNGINGKDGVDGKNGVNGKDGVNGINGTNGKNGSVGATGLQGIPGKDGINGKDGVNGKTTAIQVFTATTKYCANGGTVLYIFTDTNNNGTYESYDSDLKIVPICNPSCDDKNCKHHKYDDCKDDKDNKTE